MRNVENGSHTWQVPAGLSALSRPMPVVFVFHQTNSFCLNYPTYFAASCFMDSDNNRIRGFLVGHPDKEGWRAMKVPYCKAASTFPRLWSPCYKQKSPLGSERRPEQPAPQRDKVPLAVLCIVKQNSERVNSSRMRCQREPLYAISSHLINKLFLPDR